jgi:peptidoglycan hydrolase-like protein with peptidoglycan-binding domain
MGPIRATVASALLLAALALPQQAAADRASVAALQTALRSLDLYGGFVDGVRGPLTRGAVVSLQRRRGLAADGIAGPQTRGALGWRGRPSLGSRAMSDGARGWDVAALQYLLQRGGYGPGTADGWFGGLTAAAVQRAQSAAGIAVDGVAGPATLSALRGGQRTSAPTGTPGGPVAFLRPVGGLIGDGFGVVRANGRAHQGLDFPVGYGTLVGAAGVGTTIFAGYNAFGYGNLVVVQHRLGYTTWYAHLQTITTWVGEQVVGGTRLGYVGSTGYSTGPHLHFEVRRYNTPINPMPQLLSSTAARKRDVHSHARDHCPAERKREQPRRGSWIARERLC